MLKVNSLQQFLEILKSKGFCNVDSMFCMGIAWSSNNLNSSWVSVANSIPYEHFSEAISVGLTPKVLVRTEGNKYAIANMKFMEGEWVWECDEPNSNLHNVVTHWMIIPKVLTKEELERISKFSKEFDSVWYSDTTQPLMSSRPREVVYMYDNKISTNIPATVLITGKYKWTYADNLMRVISE